MRNHIVLLCFLPLLASEPLAAQNSARDFTLPEPTQTARPQVQGPVDDTGVVPIGPRVIPTERPAPQPATSPTTSVSTSASPRPNVTPTAQPRPVPTARPIAQPSPQAPTQPDQPPVVTTGPTASPALDDGLSLPPAPPTAPSQATAPAANEALTGEGTFPIWLQWVLGGLVLLAGLLGILAAALRRRARAAPPKIIPPIAAEDVDTASLPVAPDEIRFDTRIEVESLSRSFRMVTVNYRIEIANRSARAIRDLTFAADLLSAARGADAHDQLANISLELPPVGTLDRVGPSQSRSLAATAQMPVESIEVFAQGQVPMFIPLLRLKITGTEIGELAYTYALGLKGIAEDRVNPLPLNDPLGSYQDVRAVRVDRN